jgi:hypothetical protein
MKRFLVLLLLVAGGLAAAALVVPSNAATVNGKSITQNQLNADVTAVAKSADYQCYLSSQEYLESNGQAELPPVDGVGQLAATTTHSTATTAFVGQYLDTEIGHQLVLGIAAQHHVAITADELKTARTDLEQQISGIMTDISQTAEADVPQFSCGAAQPLSGSEVLGTLPSSFRDQLVRFDATSAALEEDLGGAGSTAADLKAYFDTHRPMFDTTCFTVAPYTSLSDAQAALAKVASGASFASIASAITGGGPQGCDVLYGITSELPTSAKLQSLALNTVSAPVAFNGDYLLIEITSRAPTPYVTAKAEVQRAAETAGGAKAQAAITRAEKQAVVSVNPRYGTWARTGAEILLPTSPAASDVLNSAVNATAQKAVSPLGSGTSSTGQSG